MKDNDLFTLVRSVILAGLAARGYAGWDVARKFQPVQQGANSAGTVYLFKITDKRYGSPQEVTTWDDAGGVLTRDESQQYTTTLQASVLLTETTDPAALTASDVANDVCAIMQAPDTLAALQAQQVGIFRVTDVRNPYDVNDRNAYAADPSFDFVLTHRREWQTTAPYAVTVDGSTTGV